jgi:uncharacterized membrane protein YbhN (UPF0104 family)
VTGVIAGFFFHYTYKVEVGESCWADGSSNKPVPAPTETAPNGHAVNVADNFKIVLELSTWTILVSIVQELLRMLNFKLEAPFLNTVIQTLGLAWIVQFVAFIMMHVYRLRHTGKVCAGDYLTEEEWQKEDLSLYLDRRGEFLWGWLLANWIVLGLACCIGCAAVAFLLKKN